MLSSPAYVNGSMRGRRGASTTAVALADELVHGSTEPADR
jgi:precorrin isomerase